MDPNQELVRTRKLMAAVKAALEKIIDDFRHDGSRAAILPPTLPTAPSPKS